MHLASIFLLIQSNQKERLPEIDEGITTYLDAILDRFDEGSFCNEYMDYNKPYDKFGTCGLAGFGLIILTYLDERYLNFKNVLSNLNSL